MMSEDKTLAAKLSLWAATRDDQNTLNDHLEDKHLYRAAQAGGLMALGEKEREHLSRCLYCLHRWAEWQYAVNALDEHFAEEASDVILSHTSLQAAATTKRDPLRLRSQCGRFFLSLLPQVDDRQQGLVILEVALTGEEQLNGWKVSVRDRKGQRLLEGILHNGRVARPCNNLDDIDLATCTVVLKRPEDSEPRP